MDVNFYLFVIFECFGDYVVFSYVYRLFFVVVGLVFGNVFLDMDFWRVFFCGGFGV